jgi:hypothetical protein
MKGRVHSYCLDVRWKEENVVGEHLWARGYYVSTAACEVGIH